MQVSLLNKGWCPFLDNEKRAAKKRTMKALGIALLIWTIGSILLAGALDIKYANYILLGVWVLIVMICLFIDKYMEKKYTKKD